MNRRKGFIAVVLGVLCAFVLGACGVLGIDVSEKVKTPEQSGSLELENEEKAAYATAGQLKYPLAALNAPYTLVNLTGNGVNVVSQTVTLSNAYVYLFECWGAQGGAYSGNSGGKGGYSRGYYQPSSSSETAYVYAGGQSSTQGKGGANGGAGTKGGGSGGGGGGSDIRIGGTSLNNRVIVAGGGGGAGAASNENTGIGGGENGGNGVTNSGYRMAQGGTQSSGGAAAPSSGGHSGMQPGTFGNGGLGYGSSGGGGGGGWYGGGGGLHTCGAGGSGYVGGVKWQNGTANGSAVSFSSTDMMSSGVRTGNGCVKITRFNTITINNPNTTIANQNPSRGRDVTVNNKAIATEYNNSSWGLAFAGSDVNSVGIYYSTDNGATFASAVGRYVDSVSVSRTATTDYSQNISFKPRVYMRNQTLYFRMYSNQYKFYIYLPFTITTTNAAWAKQTTNTGASNSPTRNNLVYRVGDSTAAALGANDDPIKDGLILNPAHDSGARHTLYIAQPIGVNSSFTVNATDFYTDADRVQSGSTIYGDGVYITSANKNGGDADFDTTMNSVSEGLSFSSYGSITIKPKTTDNTSWMRLTLTLRNYERLQNYSGVSLPSGSFETNTSRVKWAETTVDVVFRLDNTRPVPMSGTAAGSKADALVKIKSGETKKIYINEFAYDPDRNVNRITSPAGGGNAVIVPSNVFVPVKKNDKDTDINSWEVATLAESSIHYKYALTSELTYTSAAVSSLKTAQGKTATGFKSTWIDEQSGEAYVSWAVRTDPTSGLDYIEFTGLRATDYKMQSAYGAYQEGKGHFYVLVHIQDGGEEDDDGIWLPIAIEVTDSESTPNETIPDFSLKTGATAYVTPWGATVGDATYGMGILHGSNNPSASDLGYTSSNNYTLKYLATDRDNFAYTDAEGNFATHIVKMQNDPLFIDHRDPLNDFILRGDASDANRTTSGTYSDFEKFFTVEFVKLYMPKTVYSTHVNYAQLVSNGYVTEINADVVAINGLKITAKKSTLNMYIQFRVKVTSARIIGGSGIDSAETFARCRVEGNTLNMRKNVAIEDGADNSDAIGQTLRDTAQATVQNTTVRVHVKRYQILKVSPYDIVSDADLPTDIDRTNSNPDDVDFEQAKTRINKAYAVPFADSATGNLVTAGSMAENGMRMERLRFGVLGRVQNSRYAEISPFIDAGSDPNADRSIDYIMIEGREKPSSANIYTTVSVDVFDSLGNTITVTFEVVVDNSAPTLSAAAANRDYFRLSASGAQNASNDEILPDRDTLNSDTSPDTNQFFDTPGAAADGDHSIQRGDGNTVYYNVREFTERELLYDVDQADRERSLVSINEANGFKNYTKVNGRFVELEKEYVHAEIANGTGMRSNERVLKVTGISSSQGLAGGLFLGFTATDTESPVTLYLQFEVMDSAPAVITDGLGTDGEYYTINVDQNDLVKGDKGRYIVSDADTENHITNQVNIAGLTKVIARDPDSNHKVVPAVAISGYEGTLPQVVTTEGGNGSGVYSEGATPSVANAAVWLTYDKQDGEEIPGNYSTAEDRIKLTFYDDNFREVDVTGKTWKEILEYHWSIYVSPAIISSAGSHGVRLHFTLASSNRDAKAMAYGEDGIPTDSYSAEGVGTEGGFKATSPARVRQDGSAVYDNTGRPVENSVENFVTVNLKILLTRSPIVNNFEPISGVDNNKDLNGNPYYYAQYPVTKDGQTSYGTYIANGADDTYTFRAIDVSTNGYASIPLSYFAHPASMRVRTGEMTTTVNYATRTAVENRNAFSDAYEAITIYDDKGGSWTGNTLLNNPYVNIEWASEAELDLTNNIYYNKTQKVYDSTLAGEAGVQAVQKTSGYGYSEDRRGIKLSKKYQRSNDDVYISLRLTEWQAQKTNTILVSSLENGEYEGYARRGTEFNVPDFTEAEINNNYGYSKPISDAPVVTVTAKLNIANSEMTLSIGSGNTYVADGTRAVIHTSVGASNPAIFLSNVGTNDQREALSDAYNGARVIYNVQDKDNVNGLGAESNKYTAAQRDTYRDRALFLLQSVAPVGDKAFDAKQKEYIEMLAHGTSDSSKKLQNYLGGTEVPDGFEPNPGYSNYFDLGSTTGDTGLLTIVPKRKTSLDIPTMRANKARLQELAGSSVALTDIPAVVDSSNASHVAIIDAYARLFDLRYDKDGFYYPFKLLAFDNYGDSGLLKASIDAVEIKVYIDNTAPTVNTMMTSSASSNTISFSLSVADDNNRTFDIASLINDNNMERADSNVTRYLSQKELLAKYNKNTKDDLLRLLTTDYIKSLEVVDANGAKIPENQGADDSAVGYSISYATSAADLSFQQVRFTANKRVKTRTVFRFRFLDNHDNVIWGSNGAPTEVTFSIGVANSRPEYAPITNGLIDGKIVMTTGQSFAILATTPEAFLSREAAESNSYVAYQRRSDEWRARFEDLASNDKRFPIYGGVNNAAPADAFLGSLLLFTDDTPWALRFLEDEVYTSNSDILTHNNSFRDYHIMNESQSSTDPVAYRFEAKGPGNVTLHVRAYDEETSSYRDREIQIQIVSTAPKAITEDVPDDVVLPDGHLTGAENEDIGAYVFEYDMKVGDVRTFNLTDFAYDIDRGDNAKMKLSPVSGSTYFHYAVGTGSPSSAVNTARLISVSGRGDNYFTVSADNFTTSIDQNDAITSVKFIIRDGSGAAGDLTIVLRVKVTPSEIVSAGGKHYDVKSVLKYFEGDNGDGNSSPTRINLVTRGDRRADGKWDVEFEDASFIDKDLSATSTQYELKLYSLRRKGDDGRFTEIDAATAVAAGNDYLVYDSSDWDRSEGKSSVYQSSLAGDNTSYIWEYLGIDGIKFDYKTGILELIPKKSTPDAIGSGLPIKLHAVLQKVLTESSGGNKNYMTSANTFTFTVENSAPTATPEISDNMNDDRTRFLTFSGYRKSFRDYTVFEPDPDKAAYKNRTTLFEDYDGESDSVTVKSVAIKKNEQGNPMIYKVVDNKNVYYSDQVMGDDGSGRGEAVSVRTNIENTVRFTINRRISVGENDNLPTYVIYTVTAVDSAGNEATTDITVVVNNSVPGISLPDPDSEDYIALPSNVTLSAVGREYTMTVKLEQGAKDTNVSLKSFYTDLDFEPGSVSTDRAYFINGGNSNEQYYDGVGTGDAKIFYNRTTALFSVNATRDNEMLVFRALSTQRGASVSTRLIINDGTGADDVTMEIILVIDNSAPTLKEDAATELYLMGNNTQKSEFDDALDPTEYNLYDFITDINENDLNPDNPDRVQIGAQGGASGIVPSQIVREVTKDGEIVNEDLVYVVPSGDKFSITPRAGYYGRQEITIRLRDGASDGLDTKYAEFVITVFVTRNPEDVPVADLRLAYNKLVEITPEMLFTDEEGKNQGIGFVIKSIVKQNSNSPQIEITSENSSNGALNANSANVPKWFVRAKSESGETPVNVEIALIGREDQEGESVIKPFKIINIENKAPVLTDVYKTNVLYASNIMVNNSVSIPVRDIVYDEDSEILSLLKVKSKKSIVVDATIDKINECVVLNFKGRGTSPITVTLTDESLREYTYTFVAENIDLPQLNFFLRVGANVQSNPLIYTIILCGILLLLILIIIIIAVAKKKKRMREEIEALLVSEMELEEQMLKLASSPSPTFYQSYGYLSPTQNVQNNPQFMLGEGQNPGAPNNDALGLNAGTGSAPNAAAPNMPPPNVDDDDL